MPALHGRATRSLETSGVLATLGVGEIYDETDRDVAGVEHEADGSLLLAGNFPVHDLADLGVELPEGDYAAVVGMVLADSLGQIPDRPGDAVAIDGWTATVLAVDHHAITRIRLSRGAKKKPFGQEHGA